MLIFLHSSIRILEFHMHEELCQRLVEVGLLEIKIRTHFILTYNQINTVLVDLISTGKDYLGLELFFLYAKDSKY